jgi:uncharacterized protein
VLSLGFCVAAAVPAAASETRPDSFRPGHRFSSTLLDVAGERRFAVSFKLLLSFVKVTDLTKCAWRACAALYLAAALWAQPPAPEKIRPTGYLTDLAGVVDDAWKPRIEGLCAQLDQNAGAQLAVVTIRSLEGEVLEEYANRWFRAWGIGRKENKGVLLLLVIQDRRMRLEVGYGLEPLLPDGFSGSVLREMRDPLRQGRYGEALFNGASLVAARITNQAAAELPPAEPAAVITESGGGYDLRPLIPLAPFVLFMAFLIMGIRRARRLGSAGSGWSSGGFGSYDSGSSFDSSSSSSDFGGFGGGDSGGGGASSDW